MIIAILISLGVVVFGGVFGVALWLISYVQRSQTKRIAKEATTAKGLSFRWCYVILPIALLLLSVLLSAYFYPRLPAELATHFTLDGTPDGWLSREMTLVLVLAPQFFLAVVAIAVSWGITKIGFLFKSLRNTGVKPEQIIFFMGNMIALPQLILCFAMLDIFSYNSFQRHLMPMWLFILIILVLATAAFGLLLTIAVSRMKQQPSSQPSQRTKERE